MIKVRPNRRETPRQTPSSTRTQTDMRQPPPATTARMTMRPSIVDVMPMTDAQFGLLTTIFLIVYGVLSPFAG